MSTYRVAIRHDGGVDILISTEKATKKEYKFITPIIGTKEKTIEYAKTLHFKIPLG